MSKGLFFVSDLKKNLIILQPYNFPTGASSKQFQVKYINSLGYYRTRHVYFYGSQPEYVTYTIRSLSFEETYNISVRARVSFRGYGYYSSLSGEYSDSVLATTVETGKIKFCGSLHSYYSVILAHSLNCSTNCRTWRVSCDCFKHQCLGD